MQDNENHSAMLEANIHAHVDALKSELKQWLAKKSFADQHMANIAMLELGIVGFIEVLGEADALESVQSAFHQLSAGGHA